MVCCSILSDYRALAEDLLSEVVWWSKQMVSFNLLAFKGNVQLFFHILKPNKFIFQK